MESKVISEKVNPFLNRTELVIEIRSDKTPTKQEILEITKKDENLTVIRKVNSNFGTREFLVEMVVYDSVEDKEKVEVIPKKVRKKMEEERKATEEAARKEEEAKKKAEEEAKAAAEAEAQKETEEKSEELESKEEEKVE